MDYSILGAKDQVVCQTGILLEFLLNNAHESKEENGMRMTLKRATKRGAHPATEMSTPYGTKNQTDCFNLFCHHLSSTISGMA